MGPLEGIRVLDFTHVLAGPFCTRLIADMGADVVKVNSRTRVAINAPAGPYFSLWNRNKRTVALDMTDERARNIARDLAQKADVVIDNFSMGVLDRWEIGYDDVSPFNAKVIYLQMSGMGSGGPWSNYVTYAPTIHALSGITHTTGVPGRQNIGVGFSYNDHLAGLHAAVALLAAIEARNHTGKGQRIDISQFEIAVNLLGPVFMDYFANGNSAQPTGNDLPYDDVVPHGCYRCAGPDSEETIDERWIAIACMNDDQWSRLVEAMGNPDWAKDESFSTVGGRIKQRSLIDQSISSWTRDHEVYAVMEMLQSKGVPAGVVQTGIDLMESDPQLQQVQFIREIDEEHPRMPKVYADKLPIDFENTPCETYRRPRILGEDNAEILADWLDIDEATVKQGEEDGYLI